MKTQRTRDDLKADVLFVGAGHAHLYSFAHLDSFIRLGATVAVVAPAPFWYSGMGPGLLSGRYGADDASVDVRAMVENRGGRFIEAKVTEIDAAKKRVLLDNGARVFYDVLSLNVGSEVRPPTLEGDAPRLFAVKPVSRFLALRSAILEREHGDELRLLVIGGGPAGCEAAANAATLCERENRPAKIRLVTAAETLLPGLPAGAGKRMAGWFERQGVVLYTGRRVERCRQGGVVCEDQTFIEADFVVAATGVHPPELLRRSGLTTDEGGALVVDEELQSISHPGVFGGGDCISLQSRRLDRVGVHAVRESPILFHNLLAAVDGRPGRPFVPQDRYLLVLNRGDGTGLLTRGRFSFSGRLPFLLKNWLDRRFITKYQRAVETGDKKDAAGRPQAAETGALLLFARFPVPGKAKTRMIPALGPEGAARLYRRLAERTVAIAREACGKSGMFPTVCFTGARRRDFRAWLGTNLHFQPQTSGDLGTRMREAFGKAFADGAARAVAIGTDVPGLSVDLLSRAAELLADHDVVLGPAGDGGYYLIGMTHHHPELFTAIDWSTDRVARQTRAAIGRLGLTLAELPVLNDVDRPEDLVPLRADPEFADVFHNRPLLSVVIPTLNEAEYLGATLERVLTGEEVEVIVADGGSDDTTRDVAAVAGATVLPVDGGRAAQQNAGAAQAKGRHLLFLHADTLLPEDYEAAVRRALDDPRTVAGAFRFGSSATGLSMRLVEWGTNLRSSFFGWPYGDQGLFIEKRVFNELGGFAPLPIMEDFELVRRLRRRGRVVTVRESVITSARRWQRLGILRTILCNQAVLLGYFAGISPKRLARFYRGTKEDRT